jgi:hypothetical protein
MPEPTTEPDDSVTEPSSGYTSARLPDGSMLRFFKKASIPWLKYQVGHNITRPELTPLFNMQRAVIGHDLTKNAQGKNVLVTVFHLDGWGETQPAAVKMAAKKR